MKRFLVCTRLCLPAILLLIVFSASPAVSYSGNPETAPATTSAPSSLPCSCSQLAETESQPSPAAEARELRLRGIEDGLAGRFEEASARLARASALAADPVAKVGAGLLEDYVAVRRRIGSDRAAEYQEAVARVRRSILAQEYQPKLIEAKLLPARENEVVSVGSHPSSAPSSRQAEQAAAGRSQQTGNLRGKVTEAVLAYARVPNGESLETASAPEVAALKTKAAESLSSAADKLVEAGKLLAGDASEYGRTFRSLADKSEQDLRRYQEAWRTVVASDAKGRLAESETLRKLGDATAESLGDLEVMVSVSPWRAGLSQARLLVEELADDKAGPAGQDWYARIKSIAEEQGRKAVQDVRWNDALVAYFGLSDLEEGNEEYAQQVKVIRKHVRVLALYGEQKPASGGAESRPREVGTTWRDLVAGVDSSMVKKAISELERYYVIAVDYRKVARGGLSSVKVLAETPQAAESFPGLGDQGKRKKFLETVEREAEAIDKDDRVDHVDVQRSLIAVMQASERTVGVPLEVIAVEFTEGMLEELDEFSSMIWPHDVANFRKQTTGEFCGVGIQITKEPGEPLKVVTPLAGSPAYKQGIKTGDTIVAVDGQRTEGLSIENLVSKITGERGTRVVLSITRPGMLKPKDFSMIRDVIHVKTVRGWRQLPDGEWDFVVGPEGNIGYIRVTQFTEQTTQEIAKALDELKARNLRSLVLDMRDNPGGMLRSATEIADEFLRAGRVVSTKGRPSKPVEITANPDGRYVDGDLVVLVNRRSASAAEIVSGALKDWRRGIIVGERTYGKGSVQQVIPIRNDRAYLKLTGAYYYLPSGRLLHRENGSEVWGVDPDIEVRMTPKQTDRWLDLRRKTDVLREIDPGELTEELGKQFEADLQLNTAVLLLRLLQLKEAKLAA